MQTIEPTNTEQANVATDPIANSAQGIQQPTEKGSPESGFALALTLLIFSVFFYFQPRYFEDVTTFVQFSFLVVSSFGLGVEIHRLAGTKRDIFKNLFMGIGLLLFCGVTYRYFSDYIIAKVVIFLVSFFGVYGVVLGFTNSVFTLSDELATEKPQPSELIQEPAPTDSLSFIKKFRLLVVGAIYLVSAIVQILAWLNLHP